MNRLKICSLLLALTTLIPAFAADPPQMKAYLPHYRMKQLFPHDLNRETAWYNMHPYGEAPGASYTKELPGSYSFSRGEMILQQYDEIIYFSMEMKNFPDSLLTDSQRGDLAYLQRLFQFSDTRLSLCINGSSSDFMPVLRDDGKKQLFYRILEDIMIDYSLSGIDLDWEFPRNDQEKEIYLDFLKDLRELCDRDGRKLSIAVSRFRPLLPETYAIPDVINLMSYDFYGRHSTPESTKEALEYMAARYDIPYENILMGIPYYGRIFDGYSPDYWKKAQSYREISLQNDLTESDDEADGYYFNGRDTVREKAEMGMDLGLKGFFVWEIGQDSFGESSLTAALKSAVHPE